MEAVRPRWVAAREVALVASILVIHLGLGLDAMRSNSVTIDEFLDVPVGVMNWQHRAAEIDLENAPLFRAVFFGLPLTLLGVRSPDVVPSARSWWAGYQFVGDNWSRYVELINVARSGSLLAALGLNLLVYFEARRRFRKRGAVVALVLTAFCPNLMAHGGLATLDMGLTLAFFATVSMFAWMRRSPSWTRAVLLGVALGLSQGVKYPALLLYPVLLLLTVVTLPGDESWKRRLGRLGVAFAVSVAALDAAYFFDRVARPLSEASRLPVELGSVLMGARLPVPLPWLEGLVAQAQDAHSSFYFHGEVGTQTWLSYYAVALLLKLTLPALLLAAGGAVVCVRQRSWESMVHLVVPPTLFLIAISLIGHKNFGIRYALPALPFLYVLAGQVLTNAARPVWIAVAGLLAAHGVEAGVHHPYPLSAFNEVAGLVGGGPAWLGDSNLDWGQGLPALAQYLHEQGVEEVALAYYGRVPPQMYGIRYHLPKAKEQGLWVVSTSLVQGLPYFIAQPDSVVEQGGVWTVRADRSPSVRAGAFAWLRTRTPEAVLGGGSLRVYRFP